MATTDTGHDRTTRRTVRERLAWHSRPSLPRYSSGINVLAALWLLAAPFVLGYSAITAAVTNAIIVGLLVLTLAGYRTAAPARASGASWLNALLGVWLLAAPFVLDYSATTEAVTNDMIVGLVMIIFGVVSAVTGARLSPES